MSFLTFFKTLLVSSSILIINKFVPMLFSDLVYIFDFTTFSWPENATVFALRPYSKKSFSVPV